jgi:hypothetical protein
LTVFGKIATTIGIYFSASAPKFISRLIKSSRPEMLLPAKCPRAVPDWVAIKIRLADFSGDSPQAWPVADDGWLGNRIVVSIKPHRKFSRNGNQNRSRPHRLRRWWPGLADMTAGWSDALFKI